MPPTCSQLLARLARAFPRQPIPPETHAVYAHDLATVPTGLLEAAVTEVIRTEDWFPTLARLRAVCAERLLALPTETQALAQVEARIRWGRDVGRETPEEGAGRPPAVHPLVVEALGQVGGYSTLRTSDEPAVVRGMFAKAYRQLRAAAVRETQVDAALEAHSRPRELPDGLTE